MAGTDLGTDVQGLLVHARALLEAGDSEGARRALIEAVPTAPADANATDVVRFLAEANEPEAAWAWLAKTRASPGQIASAVRAITAALTGKGALGRAIEIGEAAAQISPDNATLLDTLATLYQRAGRGRAAIAAWEAAVRSDPSRIGYRRSLATARERQGDLAGAIAEARAAVEQMPSDHAGRVYLAMLLLRHGDEEAGFREFEAAADLDPTNAAVRRQISQQYLRRGDIEGAIRWAAAAAEAEPGNADHRQNLERLRQRTRLTVIESGSTERLPVAPGYTLPTELGERATPRIADGIATQVRVIGALVLRDMRTMFAESRLGYVWALLEPLAHVAALSLVWLYLRTAAPLGGSPIQFFLTGIIPFFVFSRTGTQLLGAIQRGRNLLKAPLIKPLDLLLARALLVLATQLTVGAMLFAAAILSDVSQPPDDPLGAAAAFACLWVLGTGFGIVNGVIGSLLWMWSFALRALFRILYFASGVFFIPEMIPVAYREYFWWNPIMQLLGWFRAAYYATYEYHDLSLSYVWGCALGLLILGLCLERALRPRVLANL